MTEDRRPPRAPNGLKSAGNALWKAMHAEFDFSQDPHRRLILEQACRTADVIDRLQAEIDANDLRVRGSQGQPVAAPEIGELRQYRALLAQLITKLALPDTPEVDEQKRQHISDVRRAAAQAPKIRIVT